MAAMSTRLLGTVLALLLSSTGLARQGWTPLVPEDLGSVAEGAEVTALGEGKLLVSGGAELERFRLRLPTELEGITALRLEVLPHESLPESGPGLAHNGNFVLNELTVTNQMGRNRRSVEIVDATATYSQPGWPVHGAVDGDDTTGWAILGRTGKASEAIFNFARPLGKGRRVLDLELSFNYGSSHSIGGFRVSVTNAAGEVRATAAAGELSKLQIAVNEAIDRGVRYLIDHQDIDGSWPGDRNHYDVGGTALNAYALVKSGVSSKHVSVRRALAYIDAHPPHKTYEAGCVLMLYSSLDHARYRERSEQIVDLLVEWQVGDWGYPGGHSNPAAAHTDLSNTQYGALGFFAATKMGLEVPKVAWRELAKTTLRYQHPYGGFGYVPGQKPKGSMTAAGTAILALCLPHLSGGMRTECQAGLNGGIRWLDEHFQPTENTGAGQSWLLYYLYGVERVGAFVDRDRFNKMDWYREGARYLVGKQTGEGGWKGEGRPHASTSFALLFLNRASAPISSATLAQRIYGEDDPEVEVNLRAAGDTPLSVWVSSFGTPLLDRFAHEGEREEGPRVARVEYLTTGGVIVADGRGGGVNWTSTTREPKPGWERPGAALKKGWGQSIGAFGPWDSAQAAVGTEWTEDELWMVHDFEVDPARLVEPRLEVCFQSQEAQPAHGTVVRLFDEEPGFADLLTDGGGKVSFVAGGATGKHALEVGAPQAHKASLPGWSFRIREKPAEGEFRYLRFRWRKPEGGVMVQLAFEGNWTRAQRYHAGPNSVKFEPSVEVAKKSPKKWVTVTRDLWADHGDGLLTGVALTSMDGPGQFDGFFLARTEADLRKERRASGPAVASTGTGATADQPQALTVLLNGEPVAQLARETTGYEAVLQGEALKTALKKGNNRLAVHARNASGTRAVDVGLTDFHRLGGAEGDAGEPAGGARFPSRVTFTRPGRYSLWARLHLTDPTTGKVVQVNSKPLEVNIEEAPDPESSSYALHAGENLLNGPRIKITASSELQGWPVDRLVDGRYDLAWLSADGDPDPELRFEARRPLKASALLLSPCRADRTDKQRTSRPRRVAVTLNDKGPPLVVDLDPSPLHKTRIELPPKTRIKSMTLRVLDRTAPGHPSKTAVGFAEIELLGARR